MNRLFSFISKGESHIILRIAAKVFRVLYIASGFLTSIYFISFGAFSREFRVEFFVVMLFVAIFAFIIIVLIGYFIEALLVGFANIVENQFEELVIKNKTDEKKESFLLSRKQNANFELLNKLNELKESGAITEEEFEKKKKDILNSI